MNQFKGKIRNAIRESKKASKNSDVSKYKLGACIF